MKTSFVTLALLKSSTFAKVSKPFYQFLHLHPPVPPPWKES